MLLTQGQVSVALSAAIVVIFTLLLFVSGYVIQQRTVSGLQAAIKPRLPQAPSPIARASIDNNDADGQDLHSSRFFRRDGSHVAYLDLHGARSLGDSVDWQRLAHVQLARSHHDVCNAVMLLADLHRLKSPARRVLLFPQAWAADKAPARGQPQDPYLDSSRRLMRLAARRYGVELRPVSPWGHHDDDGASDSEALLDDGQAYSLGSAFALTDFDRVLRLETPGLLQDALPLDALLAFTDRVPFAMLHDTAVGDGVHAQDLFLLQPSGQMHEQLVQQRSLNDSLLANSFPGALLLDSTSESGALVRSIAQLHEPAPTAEFNRSAFLADVSYLRFSDPKLPGPEYDASWSQKLAARPKNKDADWIWTKLYSNYAQKRMEVCGLDLETWHP